jgi:hypothetical protein
LEKSLVHAYIWLPSRSGVRVEIPLKPSENNYGNKVTSHTSIFEKISRAEKV